MSDRLRRTLDPGARLADVVRGPVVESTHLGHVVVLGPDGAAAAVAGDPDLVLLARSSLKPLQVVSMVRAGLRLDDEGLAIASASHSGQQEHRDAARRVVEEVGRSVADLRNTPDVPLHEETAFAWRAAGREPRSLAQNCSGKHAAMVATCVANGWPVETYLDPEHPLQRAIRAGVEDLTGVAVEHVTVDGCGAPLLSTTLRGLARGMARVATGAEGTAEGRVAHAIRSRPFLVGGAGRDVTAFLEAVPGLVAKDGAEAVYAAALPDGTAVALKVADGGRRAVPAVMASTLEVALRVSADAAGRAVDDGVVARLREIGRTPVLGHGRPVGEVVPVWRPDVAGAGAA